MNVTKPTISQRRNSNNNLNKTITLASVSGLKIIADTGQGGPVRQIVLGLTNVALSITDDGSTGHASQKLFDFPGGSIIAIGGLIDLTLSATAGGNIQCSLGTTATADATLSSTDADLCPASTASASVAEAQKAAVTYHDGTVTAKACYLNAGTASDPSSGATLTLNGTIVVTFINQGDFQ